MNVFLLAACHNWPHGSHVSGQEQKHFSSLGTKLYFHVNSSRKNSIVLTPTMAALSRGRNQEWFTKAPFWEIVKNCYLEDIIWPLEDTKFLFECGKISHSFASIYYIDTNKIPNHLTLFIYLFIYFCCERCDKLLSHSKSINGRSFQMWRSRESSRGWIHPQHTRIAVAFAHCNFLLFS